MLDLSQYIDQNNLHHAYLIEGESEKILPELFEFLEKIGVQTKANPDMWCRTYDTFTIDDARELKELQIQKIVSGEKKIFIIATEFFTTEAQNALLKVFEEPASRVHFFIITPRANYLLKTLHSRVVIIRVSQDEKDTLKIKKAKKFIEGEKEDRLEFVKTLMKKHEKDPEASSDHEAIETAKSLRAEALLFLDNLEYALQEKTREKRKEAKDYCCFEEIWRCRDYMNSRGSSVKMLLEHLALVL